MNYKLKQFILKPMDLLYKLNPEFELRLMFWLQLREKLVLKNPRTFNEKLQWIKLYYKNPIMTKCVDKYQVRKFVKDNGLGNILNKLYWQGFDPKKIPFDNLPNQFVIKATHGSGFNIIVKNKEELNKELTIKKLERWLSTKFIPSYGEWFYGVERPRVIIEKYLSDDENDIPTDYKIFCFEGIPKYIRVDTDRYKDLKQTFYDINWNKKDYKSGFENDNYLEKPKKLNEMLDIASELSKNFPHVRVDLFEVNEKIYFGEMTFTNGSGFDPITPKEFDLELGSYINLKNLNCKIKLEK